MSDYSIANLRDLEDLAQTHGFGESQEMRSGNDLLAAERIGISLQKVKPGKRHAFGHSHSEDEEVYVVLAGSGIVRLNDEVVPVGAMDAVRVAPSVSRGFEAGPEGLELIAFGTHTEGDAEIESDFWDD
jgi:uncharacterized cupin superfamily protein